VTIPWTTIEQSQDVRNVVQENLLAAKFFGPLQPNLIIRSFMVDEADPWTSKADSQVFTRDGLLPKTGRQRQPGVDPVAQNLLREQWVAYLAKYFGSLDIFMPNTVVEVINELESKLDALGSQGGRSVDAKVRNLCWAVGMAGNSYATDTQGASTSLPVQCCFGFHQAKAGSGAMADVSASNPLAITIGASTAAVVTGCAPTDGVNPEGIYGPGVLTLAVAKAWNQYDRVISAARSPIVRSGGGLSMHSLTQNNRLLVSMFDSATARLATMNVLPFPNGRYKAFLSPKSVVSLRRDEEWRQQNQGKGTDDTAYANMYIGTVGRVDVYETSTAPGVESVDGSGAFTIDDAFPGGNAVMTNSSDVRIERPLVFGPGCITEHPTVATPVSEAGLPGAMRAASYMDDRGIRIVVNGIEVYIRAPTDKLGEVASATWKYAAGFGQPTDRLTGDAAVYKRCVTLEHGVADDG